MARTPTDIKSLARTHTKSALATLAHIMRQKKAPAAARVAAAQALLDRGWGKPAQVVTGDDSGLPITVIHRVIVPPPAPDLSVEIIENTTHSATQTEDEVIDVNDINELYEHNT